MEFNFKSAERSSDDISIRFVNFIRVENYKADYLINCYAPRLI